MSESGADRTVLPASELSRASAADDREAEPKRKRLCFWPGAESAARCTTGAPHGRAWRRAASPSRPRAAAMCARASIAVAAPPHGPPRTPRWARTLRSGGARGAGRRSWPLPQAEPTGRARLWALDPQPRGIAVYARTSPKGILYAHCPLQATLFLFV